MFERFKIVREGIDATSKLLHLGLRSLGDEGDDTDATGDEAGVFFPQLGVAVRPSLARVEGRVRRTLRALGVIDGDDVVILKLWDKQNTPTDLSEGETRVYSAANIARVIRLLSDAITLEAPTLKLGASATKGVAREGDTVRVTIPSGTTFTGTVAGNPATFTTSAPVVCDGTITSSSSKVKADD